VKVFPGVKNEVEAALLTGHRNDVAGNERNLLPLSYSCSDLSDGEWFCVVEQIL
jgi:hypothetical protein